jgi:hypothetical protein
MASVGKNTNSKLSSELKRKRPQPRRYVLCVRNNGYPASLKMRTLYETLRDAEGEQHGLMRVIDESGEDYLYPRDFFIPITLPKAAEIARIAPSAA